VVTGRSAFDGDAAHDTIDRSLNAPSVARVYDYLLGGAHNYAIDREFAERQLEIMPDLRLAARTNRAFLGRAVRYAVEERGIRQFLDIGSGLPTVGNVHDVADRADPERSCRVVYVDNEPIAHAHAQLLLAETADVSRHHALDGDFFDYVTLWHQIRDSGYIDLDKPVCLLVVALLHFMPPELEPEAALAWLRTRLPAGSLLVLSHASDGIDDEAIKRVAENYDRGTTNRAHLRTRDGIHALFGDFDLIDPGLVWAPLWRPTEITGTVEGSARSRILAGVGIKNR
jgi:S-adenosyl methyltransferase